MKCFVCGNTKDFIPLSPKFCAAQNYLCGSCGLIFIPRGEKSFSAQFYKDDGYYKESKNIGFRRIFFSKSLFTELAKERIVGIKKAFPDFDLKGKNVVDVGCGYGNLLYILKEDYNCDVLGIEPSAAAAKVGGQCFAVPIKSVLLEEFKSSSKFDIVFCSHVLEMVDDPVSFLNNLRHLLGKNGILYLEVPNIMRPTGGFTLENFFLAESRQTFSAATLNLLISSCGLSTVDYDDKGFLRFLCARGKKSAVEIRLTSPSKILQFLEEYKNSYGIADHVCVMMNKLFYLARLLYHKFKDLIYGGS